MKQLLLCLCLLLISACTTAPNRYKSEPAETMPSPPSAELPLQDRLGMRRAADDLGFAEKAFRNCEGGPCRPQYFSVVHFQLLCRDSEGTVSSAPIHLTPLISDSVRWQLGRASGGTKTDAQGFGQFTLISERPTKGQRLILRIGKQFMGFTVSEVSKVVLPQNFCI
jgi:hypothetical protein